MRTSSGANAPASRGNGTAPLYLSPPSRPYTPMPGTLHDIAIDPRNRDILISVNGELFHRDKAVVSVFDSGFILGDGVWEGLRLVKGGVPFLRQHLERLYEGAKAIFMDVGGAPQELV